MGSVPESAQPEQLVFHGASRESAQYRLASEPYALEVCRRFSELAPMAWRSLLEGLPIADRHWAALETKQARDDELDAIEHEFNDAVFRWSAKYRLEARWFVAVAIHTLRLISWARRSGLVEPATLEPLMVWEEVDHPEEDGRAMRGFRWITREGHQGRGVATSIPINIQLSPMRWDIGRHSLRAFRTAAIEEFARALDAGLAEVEQYELQLPNINWQHAEWFLLSHAGGMSQNALAKKTGKDRSTIAEGVRFVEDRLGFPYQWPDRATKPKRRNRAHPRSGDRAIH